MVDNIIGIYEIVNNANGKRYVGRTLNIPRRKSQHFNSLSKGDHYNHYLQRSYNKYGADAFTFNVLEYCTSYDDTLERERYYIELLGVEYGDKGYNMAYSYTLFKHYDANRVINTNKRKPVVYERDEAWRKNMSEKTKQYYINNPERSLEMSERFLTIDKETIYNIKQTLHDNLYLTIDDVAEMFNVSRNIVCHLSNLNSSEYINSKVNIFIKNRETIKDKRMNRIIIRMFREGKDYNIIAKQFGVNRVTIHRRLCKYKTRHDERMRENALNRLQYRHFSKIKTLYLMNNRDMKKTTEMLETSKSTVHKSMRITRKDS